MALYQYFCDKKAAELSHGHFQYRKKPKSAENSHFWLLSHCRDLWTICAQFWNPLNHIWTTVVHGHCNLSILG